MIMVVFSGYISYTSIVHTLPAESQLHSITYKVSIVCWWLTKSYNQRICCLEKDLESLKEILSSLPRVAMREGLLILPSFLSSSKNKK